MSEFQKYSDTTRRPTTNVDYWMDNYYVLDPESPKTFLKATLGSLSGAVHAIRTRKSAFAFASQAGINSGLVGLTFFGLREYVISPVLTSSLSGPVYTQKRAAIEAFKSKKSFDRGPRSLSIIRSENVIDTALSGAITGAAFNVFRRGISGLIPGCITMGLGCTFVQVIWNELRVTRVKIVSRAQGVQRPFADSKRDERTTSEKFLDGLGWIFPVKRISDEEYLKKLRAQRERVLKRIKELEDEVVDKNDTDNR